MQVFFIVGAQKSGTTWLQKTLNSLDGVHCLGEGHFIDKLMMPVAQARHEYNKMMQIVHHSVYEGEGFYQGIPDPELMGIMRTWILKIMVRNAKAPQESILALGDKTPAHSFHIPTLKRLFPRARFIHMLRDGRDVTVSALRHKERILRDQNKLPDDGSWLEQEAPQFFTKWAGFTKAVLKAEQAGIPMHTVRYEAMLADGVASLRGCIDHLLPENSFTDAQLQAAVASNSFETMSGGREPGTISNDAFVRRGQAGSWRDELSEAICSGFPAEDLQLLSELQYTA